MIRRENGLADRNWMKFFFEIFLFSNAIEGLPRKARPAFGSWVDRTLAVRVRPIA